MNVWVTLTLSWLPSTILHCYSCPLSCPEWSIIVTRPVQAVYYNVSFSAQQIATQKISGSFRKQVYISFAWVLNWFWFLTSNENHFSPVSKSSQFLCFQTMTSQFCWHETNCGKNVLSFIIGDKCSDDWIKMYEYIT